MSLFELDDLEFDKENQLASTDYPFEFSVTKSQRTSDNGNEFELYCSDFTAIKKKDPKKQSNHFLNDDMNLQIFPLGDFHLLPDEIIINVLQKCSFSDLGSLCVTHNRFRNLIISYFFLSKHGCKVFLEAFSKIDEEDEKMFTCEATIKLFRSIGLLVKKATILFPTSERIDILVKMIQNTCNFPTVEIFQTKPYKYVKFIMKSYGTIIEQLIEGWEDSNCFQVYDIIREQCNLDGYIEIFLNSYYGLWKTHELYIRCFCRMVCNSFENAETFLVKLKWFMRLIDKFGMLNRAKMMIVVFGPLICINDVRKSLPFVGWWDLCDSNFIKVGLEDLALTLRLMYVYQSKHKMWQEREIIQLVKQVSQTPDNWLAINIGILYHKTGLTICKVKMVNDIKNMDFDGAVSTLCYTIIAHYKIRKTAEYHPYYRSDFMKTVGETIELMIRSYGPAFAEKLVDCLKKITYDLSLVHDDEQAELGYNMQDLAFIQFYLLKFFLQKLSNSI